MLEQGCKGRSDPLRQRRLRPRLEGLGRLLEQIAQQDVIGGEEAVLLAVEQFVEGLAGDAGHSDHLDPPRFRVSALGDYPNHRLVYAAALRLGPRLPRQAVSSPGQSLSEPGRASTGSHLKTVEERATVGCVLPSARVLQVSP